MGSPDWLTARPVAHRGLHDKAVGRLENTLSAVRAAIEQGFAIEVDLQISLDREAMVFHDYTLERLTTGEGKLTDLTAAALKEITFKEMSDRMPTLADLLAETRGRVPLFLEIKSPFDGAPALVERAASLLEAYDGPVAVMSFDPAVVVNAHEAMPGRPVGSVAEVFGDHWEWNPLTPFRKYQYSHINHAADTRPDFIAYNVRHLPSVACNAVKAQRGIPILTWTVRTPEQRETAARHADQMIFEHFVP
jgi:glycerophosphoryl diester phosphodiesterase